MTITIIFKQKGAALTRQTATRMRTIYTIVKCIENGKVSAAVIFYHESRAFKWKFGMVIFFIIYVCIFSLTIY